MSTLYLVRHGQASFGSGNYDQLSALGREQVQVLGSYFTSLGEGIDRIYSGTLQRQLETAHLLAAALGHEKDSIASDAAFDEYDSESILREFAAGLEPAQLAASGWPDELRHDRRRFQLFLERAARAWVDGQISSAALTSWNGFHGRIVAALTRLMRAEGRSRTLIVSTSGGVIGTTVAHVLGLQNHVGIELNWAVHNASITRLIYNADKVSLSMFNGLPHLDRDGLRQLITYR
jgi:broad specificity phosphatase PhoE